VKKHRTGPIIWHTRRRSLIRTKSITDRICFAGNRRTRKLKVNIFVATHYNIIKLRPWRKKRFFFNSVFVLIDPQERTWYENGIHLRDFTSRERIQKCTRPTSIRVNHRHDLLCGTYTYYFFSNHERINNY